MRATATRTRLLAAATAALAFITHGAMAQDDHDTREAWRLFVADHTQPVVRAIDFADGKELGRYDLKGYAALTASASGQTVFATQSDHDIVHVIKTGIEFSDHGEHRDLDVSDVALLPVTFEGKRPFHVVPHDDHTILFYDRGGKADIIDEAALLEGKAEVRTVDTTKPHHGVAVTMGRHVLVSVPNTDVETKPDELPPRIGLRVVDDKGNQVGDVATCTDLHGEATSARLVAFGCKEGVLVARPGGVDGPKLELLPYPATPRNAYILTEDGDLHVLDVIKGEIVRKARITEPYSKDGHWRDPRPRLAVADGQIAVTDPRHSLVRVVEAESLKETRTIAVEGQPFTIVAVGGSGASH